MLTRTRQIIRVRWDSNQVTSSEVQDYLPMLLRSRSVNPCLLILDDAWDIRQVTLACTLDTRSFSSNC